MRTPSENESRTASDCGGMLCRTLCIDNTLSYSSLFFSLLGANFATAAVALTAALRRDDFAGALTVASMMSASDMLALCLGGAASVLAPKERTDMGAGGC